MTKKEVKRNSNFLTVAKAGDAYTASFNSYHFSDDTKWLRELLCEKKFKVGDLSSSYRVLTNWDSLNLIPEGVEEGGWRRFTLVELVWLEAIKRMRDYGLPLEEIAKIKNDVMDWNSKHNQYPVFEYYVAMSLISNVDPYIVVTNNGADIGSSSEIEAAKILFNPASLLLISVRELLSRLGYEPRIKPVSLVALTKAEEEVLQALRGGDEMEINLKVHNFKITDLDLTEEIAVEYMVELENKMREKGIYATTTDQIVDGKKVSKKVTYKKKL